MPKYDVIVVGGGPAGVSAAYDLTVSGLRVLIVDRKTFPRFKPCAGGLTTKAMARLRYSIAPVIRQLSNEMNISLYGKRQKLLHTDSPICAMTVRSELDDFCLQKTLQAGAQFLQIGKILEIQTTTEGVTLITSNHRIEASYLLGCDGAHSQVRLMTSNFKPDRTAVALEATVPVDKLKSMPPLTFDFGIVGQGYGWLFPKGDHVNVGIYTRRPEETVFGKAQLNAYAIQRIGHDELENVAGYPIATGGEGLALSQPRVLLAGDAAGFAEPLLGEGLHNAIKSGQMAALTILHCLEAGNQRLDHYPGLMADIQRDLINTRRIAKAFYKFLPISYGILKHGAQQTIMDAFAAGYTLTQSKRAWLGAHIDEPPIIESYQRFYAENMK